MIGTTRAPQAAPRARRAAEGGSLELEPIVTVLSAQFAVATGSKRLVRRRRLDTFDGRLRAAGRMLEHQIVAPGERLVLGRLDGSSPVAVPVQDLRWPAPTDVLPSGPVREAIRTTAGCWPFWPGLGVRAKQRSSLFTQTDGQPDGHF